MFEGRILIPYDVSMQYVNGHKRKIYHEYLFWGNELVIIIEGNATFFRDDLEFEVGPGDVFVLSGNYTKEIKNAKKLRFYSIFYRDSALQRLEGTFRRLEGYQILFVQNPLSLSYGKNDRLTADEPLLDNIISLLDCMEFEQHQNDPGYEQILNSSFLILITLISRAFSLREQFSIQRVNVLTRTMFFIQMHYREKLTLEKLSQISHMSVRHFSRRFKEVYHQSPMQYISKLRINRACGLLEETNLSVTDIAMACGFSDVNYFSKIFKSTFNLSPTKYRKVRFSNMKESNWRCMITE